jgi:ATP-dependent helicase/nuclease subunit A
MDGDAARRARDRAAEAQAAEYRRLLYVALTRAEDRLYVCGWHTQNAAPEDCWYRLVESALAGLAEPTSFDFTGEIADGWRGPGWRLATVQSAAAESERPGPVPRGARTPAALPAWAETPAPAEPSPPRPLAPSRPEGEEPPVRSPLGPDEGWRYRRGRLIHRLLETLPDLPPESRPAAAERYLAAPGRELAREAREEIAAVVLAVLETPEFAPIFGPGSGAEVPIVGTLATDRGVEVVSGQVDRLLVTPEAVLAVDYKSNRPAPQSAAEVAPLYLRQMAAYRAVLREIYPDRRVACALLWTDGPRLMQLSDAVLDGHSP